MKSKLPRWLAGRTGRLVAGTGIVLAAGVWLVGRPAPSSAPAEVVKSAPRPALTVSLVVPEEAAWPQVLPANGNVVAWQESVIGAEIGNYRISEVLVQVGDRVRKGQVLARIASETVASELAEARAAVAEFEASAAEARANAERARELKAQGFYSTQLNNQYQTAEQTARARLAAARARTDAAQVKMGKTAVLAPDDGVISARTATVGSLTQTGQELFRLIRGGRLEWRADVPAGDLAKLRPGMIARLYGPSGEAVSGRVRSVAPSVDPQTRNGLVYVDVPAGDIVRAGMFARGEFELGQAPAQVVPQSAVVLREGFAYVFRVDADSADAGRVAQTKVQTGRRVGEQVEIVTGLPLGARIVASGGGFLADGDAVRVVADVPAR